MSLTLGRQGGIAKPLKKRTVGQTNIAHVYDGANHIWPTSVIYFSDFTSVQLRYIWGSEDGRDLDTKSYYVNSPINSLNYVAVGWSWHSSQIPYLYWGGGMLDDGSTNINVLGATAGSGSGAPTAFQAWEKSCEDTLTLQIVNCLVFILTGVIVLMLLLRKIALTILIFTNILVTLMMISVKSYLI